MEFKNSNRLSNKELSVLKDQKQLNDLKTQIEKDSELKSRFVDHYLKYMERSRNEQSKKYVTSLFLKAIKTLSILSPDQEQSLTAENLKGILASSKEATHTPVEADNNESDDSALFWATSENQNEEEQKQVEIENTSVSTDIKVELPTWEQVNSFMSSLQIDISKPLSISWTIDFNWFLKQAYDWIQKVKEISANIKDQHIDIDELVQKIDQISSSYIQENGLDDSMKIITDVVKVLPWNMGTEIESQLPNIIEWIKSNPDLFKELKQTIIAWVTLCKNWFVDTVCDELLSWWMKLYSSLPTITPENVNDPKSQQEFMKAALKIAQLLKTSINKWYDTAKNSNIPHSKEVMKQLETQFLWQLDQIPDTIDFNDPSMKENLTKWYYQVVNMFDKTRLLASQITWWTSLTTEPYRSPMESNIASDIAQQQVQIFKKCESLKFGVFWNKKYEIKNSDWSVFLVTKEKWNNLYNIFFEKTEKTANQNRIIKSYHIKLNKNWEVQDYLVKEEWSFYKTWKITLNLQKSFDASADDEMLKVRNKFGEDYELDKNAMKTLSEQIKNIG